MLMQHNAPEYNIRIIGNSSLPPIVFLHGFLGSGQDWLPCATALATHFSCVFPDLPGHGLTATVPEGPDAFKKTVADLGVMIEHLPFQQVHLVGYSMGGRLATALMLSRPELFRSTTIISSSPGLQDKASRIERAKSDDRLAGRIRHNFTGFLSDWYQMPLFAPLTAHPDFPAIFEARKRNNPALLSSALHHLSTGRQPSYWEKLPQNRIPMMFCAGEKDTKYVEIGRQMVNLCPYSHLEIFPDCGHTLQLENRRLFLLRLLNFLNMQENHVS